MLGLGSPTRRPECRGRWGVPCDDAHGVQPEDVGAGLPGGKKAAGGSHSSAVGRSGGGCGGLSTPPLSSRAVKVAPEALGPARAGPALSGGFGGRQRDVTPAADRSRPPPFPTSAVAVGGGSRRGPGPPLQRRWIVAGPEPSTRRTRSASEASCPWYLHRQCGMGP